MSISVPPVRASLSLSGLFLPRRVVDVSGAALTDPLPGGLPGQTIGSALLAPTCIYVRQVLQLIDQGGVKAAAHITGGGFTDNIPRVLPDGVAARIDTSSWDELAVFKWLRQVQLEDIASVDDAITRF